MMEATARDAPVLKKLAGVKATGRKLKKPMVHYSLSWAPDERAHPVDHETGRGREPQDSGAGEPSSPGRGARRPGAPTRFTSS